MPESTGLKKTKELGKNFSTPLTAQETEAMNFYIQRLNTAKEMRNTKWKYFDGMDFENDYHTNENARNTYLRPKKNDSEVRVDVGIVEKKLETIYNELLSMNLQPEVRAFDENDNELTGLGEDMGDMVDRTNQIEEDDDFWQEAVAELLSQRAVFVQECFMEKKTRNGTQEIQMAQKKLVSGLKVFLGDIRMPAWKHDDQPYLFKYDRMSYWGAAQIWKDNPNWKNVQPGMPNMEEGMDIGHAYYYRFGDVGSEEVEVITYESLPDDEYQVIINGVPMFAPGTKLPWSYNRYDIQGYTVKSMSPDFYYGRPVTASAKSLAALSSETLRMLVLKFQQAIEPPLGVPSGKVYSKEIWTPGAITAGVRAKDFERLLPDNLGVGAAEIQMMKLIEDKTMEFVGASDISQGMPANKEMSATEVLNSQKQFIKQLGLAVYAITRMKRESTKLRIFNIFENYLSPVKRKYDKLSNKVQDIYRRFTLLDGSWNESMKGRKTIQLVDRDIEEPELEEMTNYENELAVKGKPQRFRFVNVKKLKSIPIIWYVAVNTKEREGTALDKAMFQDQLNQGVAVSKISGRPINGETVIGEYERKWKAKNFFQREAPGKGMGQPPVQEGQNPAEGNQVSQDASKLLGEIDDLGRGGMGRNVTQGLSKATTRPDINNLSSQI